MTNILQVGDAFPNCELPDHTKRPNRLSQLTQPNLLIDKVG